MVLGTGIYFQIVLNPSNVKPVLKVRSRNICQNGQSPEKMISLYTTSLYVCNIFYVPNFNIAPFLSCQYTKGTLLEISVYALQAIPNNINILYHHVFYSLVLQYKPIFNHISHITIFYLLYSFILFLTIYATLYVHNVDFIE